MEVAYGNGFGDKLAILCFRVISSFYYRVLRQRSLNPNQKGILKRLIKGRTARVNGVKYSLVDYESLTIVLPRFEQEMWNYLKPKTGDIFIDVGAHVGKYSFQVAKKVGEQGLVVALEPNMENYQALLEGIRQNNLKNVVSLDVAAWSKNCQLKIFFGDSSGHHTVEKSLGFDSFEVKADTIDHIVNRLKLKQVDWIKIDAEGAEFEVLKGMRNTLGKKQPKPKIIIETSTKNLHNVKKFLEAQDYKVTQMEGGKLRWIDEKGAGYYYLLGEPDT